MKKLMCLCVAVVLMLSVLAGAEEKKENTLTLNFYKRIVVLGMLPQKGDLATLLTSRGIRYKIKITDEEKEKYEIVDTPSGRRTWNPEIVETIEPITVTINEAETQLLKQSLAEANKRKSILANDDAIDACKMIEDLK